MTNINKANKDLYIRVARELPNNGVAQKVLEDLKKRFTAFESICDYICSADMPEELKNSILDLISKTIC